MPNIDDSLIPSGLCYADTQILALNYNSDEWTWSCEANGVHSSSCQSTHLYCGDGVIQFDVDEECDDGNYVT